MHMFGSWVDSEMYKMCKMVEMQVKNVRGVGQLVPLSVTAEGRLMGVRGLQQRLQPSSGTDARTHTHTQMHTHAHTGPVELKFCPNYNRFFIVKLRKLADLNRVPYVSYGVKCMDLVSLDAHAPRRTQIGTSLFPLSRKMAGKWRQNWI